MNNENEMPEIYIIPINVPKTDSQEEIEKFVQKMKTLINGRNKKTIPPIYNASNDIFGSQPPPSYGESGPTGPQG